MITIKTRDLLRDEQGSVAVWIAGGMTALMGMAALAIDTSHVYLEQNRLQATADSAALAASAVMSGGGNAQDASDAAIEYAQKNMPPAMYGSVLASQDVVSGEWDSITSSFSPGGSGSAIQVTLRRTAASGNPVNTFLAGILGYTDMDLVVRAVASTGWCGGGTMFIAGEKVTLGQDMNLSAGTCVYGALAVTAGQDPVVQEGSFIGAQDIDTITFGQNPSIPDGAIGELDLEPTIALNINQIIADLQAGNNLPPQITNVQVVSSLPSGLQANTAYVVTSSVSIDQNYMAEDVIIATTESISFGQDGRIRNKAGTCPSGGIAIGLYAAKNISIGQDAVLEGVQVVAGETVSIGQDLGSFYASVQAGKDINIGQDPNMMGCGSAMPGVGGGGTGTRLVG